MDKDPIEGRGIDIADEGALTFKSSAWDRLDQLHLDDRRFVQRSLRDGKDVLPRTLAACVARKRNHQDRLALGISSPIVTLHDDHRTMGMGGSLGRIVIRECQEAIWNEPDLSGKYAIVTDRF